MDKAESEKIWNEIKPEIEDLVQKITVMYQAAGSTRTCRGINELWQAERPGVGLGFVPPEARDVLESVIGQHKVTLHKGAGPLGKGAYFSLLYDENLTAELFIRLAMHVGKETAKLAAEPRSPAPTPKPTAEDVIDEGVARVDGVGMGKGRPEKPKTRPAEVSELVDAFNRMSADMKPREAISLLADAISYMSLPDTTLRELQRTMDMLLDAESGASS